MADDLTHYLQHKRVLVEQYLDATLQPAQGCPASLLEAMRYSVLAPGTERTGQGPAPPVTETSSRVPRMARQGSVWRCPNASTRQWW